MSQSSNADRVKALIGKSMFSAVLAREAAVDAGIERPEEVFLAAMFHNLGELLIAFYLPREDAAIEEAMKTGEVSQKQAQLQVLGLDLEHVGVAVGKHWNFPHVITHAMAKVGPGKVSTAANEEDRVRQMACFAAEVAESLSHGDDGPEMAAVLQRYGKLVEFEEKRLEELLGGTRSEYRKLASGLAMSDSAPAEIRALAGRRPVESEVEKEKKAIGDFALPDDSETEVLKPTSPGPILLDGLQEATSMLAEHGSLSQVAQVVLETLFRAFDLRRVALCLRDPARQRFIGRMGFGDDIDDYLRRLRFSERYERDVFHLALKQKTDVHIADLGRDKAADTLPDWYRGAGMHGSFLFLPMVLKERPVGCLIAEHVRPNSMDLNAENLRLVRALRNQLVLGLQLASNRG
jgi:hypothetical protein